MVNPCAAPPGVECDSNTHTEYPYRAHMAAQLNPPIPLPIITTSYSLAGCEDDLLDDGGFDNTVFALWSSCTGAVLESDNDVGNELDR
mmetsp:Transcript_5757/g.11230  ORF Transcript_5757/g.11230 Transcript_5757/m.11230 type:complete len:88 (-) Transcript_5757:102-365(-)